MRQQRKNNAATAAKQERDYYNALARQAEIITPAVESEFWKEIIEPMLAEDIRLFKDRYAWEAPTQEDPTDPKKWTIAQHRAVASRARTIKRMILSHVGKRDKYMEEAQKAARRLEVLMDRGMKPDEDGK